MVRAEEGFKCPDGDYRATTNFAGGKYSGGNVVLNGTR